MESLHFFFSDQVCVSFVFKNPNLVFSNHHVWFRSRYLRFRLIYLCSLSRYRDGLRWSQFNINLIFERFRARYISVFKGSCQIQKVLTVQLSIDRGVAELDRLCSKERRSLIYLSLASTGMTLHLTIEPDRCWLGCQLAVSYVNLILTTTPFKTLPHPVDTTVSICGEINNVIS